MRLLLIEDEKPLSAAIKKLLEQEHFAVDTAFTGPDGLDCALTGIYDAIILDVMLPGMDGFSVLSALRAQKISTPVLMLTARGELLDRVQGLNLGADYYLPKPFERSELVACLNAITRRKDAPPVQALVVWRCVPQPPGRFPMLCIHGKAHQAGNQGVPANGIVSAQSRPASAQGNHRGAGLGL